MKRTALFIAALLFGAICSGQSTDVQSSVLVGLESNTVQGNTWLIRDIGTLLNRENARTDVWDALSERVVFIDQSFSSNVPSREQFLTFFYENQDQFYFDQYLKAFVLLNGEKHMQSNVSLKKSNAALEVPHDINSLEESIEIVEAALNSDVSTFCPDILPACNVLSSSRSNHAAELLLACLDRGLIMPQQGVRFLHRMTNNYCQLRNKSYIYSYYQTLISENSIQEVVAKSYAAMAPIEKNWFPSSVDYYARLLLDASFDAVAIENLLKDMTKTGETRSFYYISAFMDRMSREGKLSQKTFGLCTEALADMIPQAFQNTPIIPAENEFSSIRKCFEFWYTNHNEFIWDNKKGVFVPGNQSDQPENNIELVTQVSFQ